MRRAYTAAEESWLRENYHAGTMNDTLGAFEREFGRRPGKSGLAHKASEMGLRKDSAAHRVKWTPERSAWFRAFVPGHTEAEISAEHERVFGSPLTEAQIGNAKHNLGVKSGTHGGRFEKGVEPHNKGKTWDEFMSPEGQAASRRTQFKAGEVRGAALAREQPVGSERVNRDGYVEVKVSEGLQGRPNSNFRMKHHIVYEAAYGSIPTGCNVVFADHDKRNFDPANLVAVPRDLWWVISKMHLEYRDAESLRACVNAAKLARAVHAAECRPRLCRRCGREFAARYAHQRTCDGCLGR